MRVASFASLALIACSSNDGGTHATQSDRNGSAATEATPSAGFAKPAHECAEIISAADIATQCGNAVTMSVGPGEGTSTRMSSWPCSRLFALNGKRGTVGNLGVNINAYSDPAGARRRFALHNADSAQDIPRVGDAARSWVERGTRPEISNGVVVEVIKGPFYFLVRDSERSSTSNVETVVPVCSKDQLVTLAQRISERL